jgi:lysyl-tRNA synthetase class 2
MSEYEREARRTRLDELRHQGIDAYPARVGPRTRVAELCQRFAETDAAELEATPPEAAIAGRLLAKRSFGKLLFLRVVEDGATLQVSCRKQEMEADAFAFAKSFDVGDFVRVEGVLWRTKTDELTLDARRFEMLSKSLRPLPEKFHGLTDLEARFRQRYLDLLANEESRRIAVTRSHTLRAMRNFLDSREFLEVETPVLQPLYGGAAARPFTTHYNSYGQEVYLRISDELYLKRLIVGGLERVYEIGHSFRNEGISKKHSPEFTMMECYEAFADYHDMMDLTQQMLQYIAKEVTGGTRVDYLGETIDFGGEWPRTPMHEAIRDRCGVDINATRDLASLRSAITAAGHEPSDAPTWAQLVDDLFSDFVEPELRQPCFITNHPVALSPLAKKCVDDDRFVERFEVFAIGIELGNAFSELNDPIDQRERFESQLKAQAEGDEEAHPLDEDFLLALEHGMPPTGGLGLGVDRVAMIMAGVATIREAILFPHMRPGPAPHTDPEST